MDMFSEERLMRIIKDIVAYDYFDYLRRPKSIEVKELLDESYNIVIIFELTAIAIWDNFVQEVLRLRRELEDEFDDYEFHIERWIIFINEGEILVNLIAVPKE